MTLEAMHNIGPTTAHRLRAVGIRSEAQLRTAGAVSAYRRLSFRYPRETTLNALWALAGALRNLDWRAVPQDLKDEMLAELDQHAP